MDAFIKKDKWRHFKLGYNVRYGFFKTIDPRFYIRPITDDVQLNVDARNRQLNVVTRLGGLSPFMEAHKSHFQDLIDADLIEFRKNKFD